MVINEHGNLVDKESAGNGYHGRCEYCKIALVTDLGYCSWDGVKCIDREIQYENEIPKEIKSYAKFKSLLWDRKKKIFVKPYTNDEYTLDQINEIVKQLNEKSN